MARSSYIPFFKGGRGDFGALSTILNATWYYRSMLLL